MFGRGSRVQVRMRCGTRTRRRRHDHRVPPSTLAAGPTGDAPGPSAFECRLTGPCPSPRSLFLSPSPLRASERGSRLPPFVRLFSLAFSGSPWAAREPAISPAQLSLALPGFFSPLARETALTHRRTAGRGATDKPKRPDRPHEPTPQRAAATADRRRNPSGRPVNPARERPLTTDLRSRVRTLSYRRKVKASEKKAPRTTTPTTGKGSECSRPLPRHNWRQRIRATPLAAP